uniref:hypothetical protein n=1 Tax=Trichocoleus desertorum TaxID=1481672 RepID=UPI0036F4317B
MARVCGAAASQLLGYEQQLPEREPHRLEGVLAGCPGLKFIIDGTERRINRPKDKAERKQYYSGKRHLRSRTTSSANVESKWCF